MLEARRRPRHVEMKLETVSDVDSWAAPCRRGVRPGVCGVAKRSDLWFAAVYTFTVVLLLLTVIVARFRRGDEKAFWFGFAVFGWGFFLLGFGPWMIPLAEFEEGEPGRLNPSLLTSKVIFFLVNRLRRKPDDLNDVEKITANTIGIAHLLITLCLAICGGMIGAMVRRRRGKIVSVKSLSIVAALAVITAFASSGFSPRPPALFFPNLAFDQEKDALGFRHGVVLEASRCDGRALALDAFAEPGQRDNLPIALAADVSSSGLRADREDARRCETPCDGPGRPGGI